MSGVVYFNGLSGVSYYKNCKLRCLEGQLTLVSETVWGNVWGPLGILPFSYNQWLQ